MPSNTAESFREWIRTRSLPCGQTWLIDRMRTLGYQIDARGMCHGITQMAVQAYLSGDINKFFKRLHALNSIPVVDFKVAVEKRFTDEKEEFKTGVVEDPNRVYAKDIYAFFDGIILYQAPSKYRDIFPEGEQKDMPAKNLVNPRQQDSFATHPVMAGIYISAEDLKTYLSCLQSCFQKIPTSIFLRVPGHAISLHFDPTINEWLYLDPNGMDQRFGSDLDLLAAKIMSAAALYKSGYYETIVFTTKANQPAMDTALKGLEHNPEWIRLHKLTEKTDEFFAYLNGIGDYLRPEYGSYLGYLCVEGDVSVVKEFLTLPEEFLRAELDGGGNVFTFAVQNKDVNLGIFSMLLDYAAHNGIRADQHIQKAFWVALETKDIDLTKRISTVILSKEAFTPESFLMIFSCFAMTEPENRFAFINSQLKIITTGAELACVMSLLTPDESSALCAIRKNIQPEIEMNTFDFSRVLKWLTPDKNLIFYEAYKHKFYELFMTVEDVCQFFMGLGFDEELLAPYSAAFEAIINKLESYTETADDFFTNNFTFRHYFPPDQRAAFHNKCKNIFAHYIKNSADLDVVWRELKNCKEIHSDFKEFFNTLSKNQLSTLFTLEYLQKFMSDSNLDHTIKMICLVKLETEGLLQPLIREIWKKDREHHAGFFSCSVSDAKKTYRDTQELNSEMKPKDHVIAKLNLIRTYVTQPDLQNEHFAKSLTATFPIEFLTSTLQKTHEEQAGLKNDLNSR